MAEGLRALKARIDVNWTYLSPAADFVVDGARTGKHRAGDEILLTNSKDGSRISYTDHAIAMIDEAESGKHIKSRFTVVSK